ncbi:MAG TPA: phosphoadenosine phosphosulfate reductase family protein [Longimicrobium sp.]
MRPLAIPSEVESALELGAALAISISGGKDSQALLNALSALHRERAWPGPVVALHADLGRAEWKQTPGHVRRIAAEAGVELVVVRRAKGDLFTRFEERAAAVAGTATPWAPSSQRRYCTSHLKTAPLDAHLRRVEGAPRAPSASRRYCTSDLKRAPCDTALRAHRLVVCAMGFRAQESTERAGRRVLSVRRRITSVPLQSLPVSGALEAWLRLGGERRLALDWNPLHRWTRADVWEACGTSEAELRLRRRAYAAGYHAEALEGWPAHPAYVLGNERVSCALCMLASRGDLLNGARHNPEAFEFIAGLEERTGSTFRPEGPLRRLVAALERPRPASAQLTVLDALAA